MIYALAGGLVATAILIVWLSSLMGTAGFVIALIVALSALIAIALIYWLRNREEHLYEDLPRLQEIRKPLTPANYSVRTNLDPPFFSYESQNYGEPKPRTRIKNVPIDRYLELQEKIDALTEGIAALSEQLTAAHAQIATLGHEEGENEAATIVIREVEPIAVAEPPAPPAPRLPLVDTTINKAKGKSLFKRAPALPVYPEIRPEPESRERRRSGTEQFFIETMANTQQQLSKMWRRR
jgi:hypothetical protein